MTESDTAAVNPPLTATADHIHTTVRHGGSPAHPTRTHIRSDGNKLNRR